MNLFQGMEFLPLDVRDYIETKPITNGDEIRGPSWQEQYYGNMGYQDKRDAKAGMAKITTLIVMLAYFIEIPIVISVLKEIGSWFTGEDFICWIEIFLRMLALASTAPIVFPVIIIVVMPISFAIIDAIYNTSDEQRLFGGGMLIGAMLGAGNASKRHKRR